MFCLPLLAAAQTTEGVIYYEDAVKLNIQLPEDADESLRAMIPDKQTFPKALYYKGDESLFKDVEEADGEAGGGSWSAESGGANIQIKIMKPENLTYKNLAEEMMTEQKDFMGRKFLIKTELGGLKWKLVKEQKEILGFACQKAELQDDKRTVTAWYTTQIPSSNGPDEFGQLPGMILEVDIDNGKRVITAKKVSPALPETETIEAPKKGDKVTKEEFEKIVEEKTKEMEKESGGNMIRIKRG